MGADPDPQPPPGVVLALALLVMCCVWGTTWVVIAEGLDDLPPLTSAAARFALAAVVMSLVARGLAAREGGCPPRLGLVVVTGGLNFAASYGIVYWAETRLPSGLVSLLWGVYPLMTAFVGHWLLPGERLVGRQWFGMVVGMAGVCLLFMTDLADIQGAGLAGLVLLISPAVSAIGAAVVKREGPEVNSLLLNRNGMILGAAILTGLAVLCEGGSEGVWTTPALLGIGYLSLFGTCLTFGLYYWVLRYVPAYKLSLIAYVTPVIAIGLGTVVRDEPLTAGLLGGGGLVLAGVWLTLARRAG